MREIKFRAWDNINRVMHEHRDINICVKNLNINRFGKKQWIYMQFTGLHDKNGKEIYEGDIVSHNGLVRQNELLIVDFKDGAFCLTAQNKKSGEDVSCTIRDLMFQAKKYCMNLELIICGNIHENPELINDSQL